MVSDLPGGGKKPRTATPLAWRIVYLVVLSVIGWSFLSTRAASAQISTEVAATHHELKALLAEVNALRDGYKGALTASDARPMIEDALEQRLSKVATQIATDMAAHVAQAVAAEVRSVTHTELGNVAPTIGAAMRKEVDAQQGKLDASLSALKSEQEAQLNSLAHRLERHALDAQVLERTLANATAALAAAQAAAAPDAAPFMRPFAAEVSAEGAAAAAPAKQAALHATQELHATEPHAKAADSLALATPPHAEIAHEEISPEQTTHETAVHDVGHEHAGLEDAGNDYVGHGGAGHEASEHLAGETHEAVDLHEEP